MSKRILVVDDDKDILTMLSFTLKNLGPEYEIVTAQGSIEALEQIDKNSFDLVVTDYMMKSITGVDLARAIRQMSPRTHVVLMTAYGNKRLRETSQFLGLDGFLDKPFTIQKFRNIIKHTLGDSASSSSASLEETEASAEKPGLNKRIQEEVRKLQVNTNARCVLLLGSDGYPAYISGQLDEIRVSTISALIAANFMGVSELAGLLGNQEPFKSSLHQGDDYNIYIYEINSSFLLAVVFDSRHKMGVVWFYTKQTATTLSPLLEKFSISDVSGS